MTMMPLNSVVFICEVIASCLATVKLYQIARVLVVLLLPLFIHVPICVAQSIEDLEAEKDSLWEKAQQLHYDQGNCREAIGLYLRFAQVCEQQKWTGAGDGYARAAQCFEKTKSPLNALKTYKKAMSAYDVEGLVSRASWMSRKVRVINKDIQRNLVWESGDLGTWSWLSILKWTSNYGTDAFKLLCSIAIIILTFALMYYPYNPNTTDRAIKFLGFTPRSGPRGGLWNLKEVTVISALIFLGRSHPPAENDRTKLLVILESLLGYFVLAILVAMLLGEILE